MKCKCGSEQLTALRSYWINTDGVRIPLYVPSLKCPGCMTFDEAPYSNFYLLHTLNLTREYARKIASGKSV